mgnify:CR=1 FL=1|jgi:hypothetical protein
MYRPSGPFNVPMFLLIPQTKTIKGSTKKSYPDAGELIYCSFRTFGGTERTDNDVLIVEDTAVVETWFRPDIKSDCILESTDGLRYEILGTPENISMRNQVLKFKIRAIRGGA